MSNKKYVKLDTITDDAPFGTVGWYSISFITPSKIEKCLMFDVIGFKVHNGYIDNESAIDDISKLRKRSDLDNIYLCKMGAISAWDDDLYADSVDYGIKKLNNYEKKHRENQDKLEMVKKQLNSEYKTKASKTHPNNEANRKMKVINRMRTKMYNQGKITKDELDALNNNPKPISDALKNVMTKEEIITASDLEYTTDWLEPNPPVAFKYGCISIFCPKKIAGLKTLCFKVRGLFETQDQAIKRAKKIQSIHPHDTVSIFPVGLWCPYSSTDLDFNILAKQLNLARKLYLDDVKEKEIEFKERAEKMIAANKKHAESQKSTVSNTNSESVDTPQTTQSNDTDNGEYVKYGTDEDTRSIIKIYEYLHEAELLGKYKCTNTVRHQVI